MDVDLFFDVNDEGLVVGVVVIGYLEIILEIVSFFYFYGLFDDFLIMLLIMILWDVKFLFIFEGWFVGDE